MKLLSNWICLIMQVDTSNRKKTTVVLKAEIDKIDLDKL